jgi:hypothetical protein
MTEKDNIKRNEKEGALARGREILEEGWDGLWRPGNKKNALLSIQDKSLALKKGAVYSSSCEARLILD